MEGLAYLLGASLAAVSLAAVIGSIIMARWVREETRLVAVADSDRMTAILSQRTAEDDRDQALAAAKVAEVERDRALGLSGAAQASRNAATEKAAADAKETIAMDPARAGALVGELLSKPILPGGSASPPGDDSGTPKLAPVRPSRPSGTVRARR